MTKARIIERLRGGLAGALLTISAAASSVGGFGAAASSATAADAFTPFMSEAEEDRIGKEEHPKVLQEFGGAYPDASIQKYVTSLGGLLKATTPQVNKPYTFTVLDSDVVNAFALPGG